MSRAVRIGLFGLLASTALLAACERPPIETEQLGYRGVQMGNVINPRTEAARRAANVVPVAQPAAELMEGVPLARDVYQNVKVVGDLQVTEFNRLMLAMTEWVSPVEGCNYCHNPENLADDSKYTKVVARRMIEMTRYVNMDWKQHVAGTGVTCYTCHRGQHVPAATWFSALPEKARGLMASRDTQNLPAAPVGLTSMPGDPFSSFLQNADAIRVISMAALPAGSTRNIKQTEHTYSLMIHMSEGLGVNCTFCHNSRSFAVWSESTPQRVVAWHGIRMARDLNVNYLVGLTPSFPANRLGPGGDVAKINCATCHRGVNKPLYGAPMSSDYPELTRVRPAPAPVVPDGEPAVAAPPAAASTRSPAPASMRSVEAAGG